MVKKIKFGFLAFLMGAGAISIFMAAFQPQSDDSLSFLGSFLVALVWGAVAVLCALIVFGKYNSSNIRWRWVFLAFICGNIGAAGIDSISISSDGTGNLNVGILFFSLTFLCIKKVGNRQIWKRPATKIIELDKDIAKKIIIESGQASISMIQRKTGWNYARAARAMDSLESCGIVGPFDGENPRKILVLSHSEQQETMNPTMYDLSRIDEMEGYEFESFIADLLRKLHYERVKITPNSGDQGVDVIAVKDGKKYAIQCKRYSQKLGNKPVQEVFAGKTIYGCSVAIVVTNNYFTEGAKEAARATGVELWDRDVLKKMINFVS